MYIAVVSWISEIGATYNVVFNVFLLIFRWISNGCRRWRKLYDNYRHFKHEVQCYKNPLAVKFLFHARC